MQHNSHDSLALGAYTRAETLASMGHWVLKLPNNELFWSEEVYRIHGVDPKTYTPELESAIAVYHPDDRDRVLEYVSRSIELGQDFQFSLRLVRRDGCIRYVNSKASCEKDSAGNTIKVFGVFQDVTEDLTERANFHKTRVAHQTLIESTNDGFWDWKIQEDYEYMSPRFWEMFGYQPGEKPHHPSAWQEMIFEEDLAVALDSFARHVETRGEYPFYQEARYRHKDGSTVVVLCRGSVIEWTDSGEPVRMIGTHTDISEQKRVEAALRASLDFNRLLINANTDLIFVKDAEFRIVDANEAFLSLYPGKTLQDIAGTTTFEAYDPSEVAQFLVEDKKALAEGSSEVFETILFPDGAQRTLLTKKMRFHDRAGVPHILGVARDVTSLKQTEEALARANEQLQEFAYRTSHDLRSPLVSSRGLISIMQDMLSKGEIEKCQKYLNVMDTSLGKLETLVTDLLCMTELNYQDAALEEIRLPDLLEESKEKLMHLAGFDRVSFEADFSASDESLLASRVHLTNVIENLMSNAIKYQDFDEQHATVSVKAVNSGKYIELSVSDNGIGIPENKQDQLFAMFKRFHPKTAFGSGLGLYMVKKNVERMNGTITFVPQKKGACFTVRLPNPSNPNSSNPDGSN